MSDVILREGHNQHFAREEGNRQSRLVYRGELMEVEC